MFSVINNYRLFTLKELDRGNASQTNPLYSRLFII